jgi:hypothetical protein
LDHYRYPEHRHSQAALRRGETLWGDRQEPEPDRPKMRLLWWKPIAKGSSLRGFAAVELPIGLKVHDIPVLASHGKIWASLPSKPQVGKDGQHRKDANGKPAYTPILEWRNRDLSARFSDAVVALVRAEYPGDLEVAP